MNTKTVKAGILLLWIIGTAIFSHVASGPIANLSAHAENAGLLPTFLSIAFVCLLGFVSFYVSEGLLPSFVVALFFGVAAQPLLAPVVASKAALAVVVSLGATLILFQGGMETSFAEFRRLFPKIALLAFPGVLITAVLLSLTISGAASLFGIAVSATTAVLLGAVLASTDPAAIIPLFQGMRFKERAIKDIVISESAMNDVVGALLTLSLVAFALTEPFSGILSGYGALFTGESALVLLTQMAYGVVAGVVGSLLLRFLNAHKRGHSFEHGADAAFLIVVPVIAFSAAAEFGGSGYLAAFIAGLVFHLGEHLKGTERFYNDVIDGFAKPAIFLLLGALIDLPSLIHYAPVGIAAALVFMLVIRPIAVFLMLGVFMLFGKRRMTARQLLFISFVRETGAIPAVLLVTLVGLGLPGIPALVPVGMWIILATLIIEPPLTPLVARRLGIAE